MYERIPLTPRRPDGPLRVLAIGRISTEHQDLESIEAGHRDIREFLGRVYRGTLHIKTLGERASGMRADRLTIVEAEEEVATETWDLVMAVDLGRIHRNPRHLQAFVQDAVDRRTRVICLGDNFDTADPNWWNQLGLSSFHHGMVVPEAARRVRSKSRSEFHKGGMVQKVRYSYRKITAEQAEAEGRNPRLRVARLDECTPVVREMRARVLAGRTYTSIARWLADEGIDPGPYVVEGVWSGRLVMNLLRDPILAGMRRFGVTLSTTLFRTGRKKREANPAGPETEYYPELAHMTREEHAELVAAMDARAEANANSRGDRHPLRDKPRSQALWPMQHPRCGVCGGLMYRCGMHYLKCRSYFHDVTGPSGPGCWNHVQVDCREVRARVIPRLLEACGRTPGFREAMVDAAWRELSSRAARECREDRSDEEEIAELQRRSGLLAQAIARGGELEALLDQLKEVEGQLREARARLEGRRDPSEAPRPATREDVSVSLERVILELAESSHEFADLLRRIIPEFTIVPVQALDCGLVRPRGKMRLSLAALPGADAGPVAEDMTLIVDLFTPASHIRAIGPSLAAKAEDAGLSLDKISLRTGFHRMAVKRALAYAGLMEAEGLDDPYRELEARPETASRWGSGKAS